MSSRKVKVSVFSYPEDYNRTLSLKRISEIVEQVEILDEFFSSKSLEQLMSEYVDKVDIYASFVDELRWYRIVLRDSESRLVKLYKA